MINCPAEGCEREFGTENGAVMHAINKTDSKHDSISDKTDAYENIEQSTNQETAEGQSGSKDESPDDSKTNPAFNSPTPDDSQQAQNTTCPDCPASDWYDAATVENHPQMPDDVPGDRVCAECGEVFDA